MAAPHWAEANLQRELGAPGTAVEFGAAILNSVAAHIAVLDQDGVIVATNDTWRRFATENGLTDKGIDFHAGIGMNYLDVCRDAAGRSVESATLAFDGIRQVLDGTIEDFKLEYPCHSPEVQRWFAMTVTPIAVKNFHGAVVLHDNITDRRLAEQERLESERRLAGFIEHMPGLAWIKDDQGRYVEANEMAARALGTSRDAVRSRFDHQFISPSSAAQLRADDLRVLSSRQPMQFEESVENTEGGLRQFLVNKFPIPQGENRPPMVGGVAVDITDRKAEEQGIREIVDTISATTGIKLFGAIAVHLTKACNVHYCFVARFDDDNPTAAQMLAASEAGNVTAGLEIHLESTAAQRAAEETFLHVPTAARQRFPNDSLLAEQRAESFMGILMSAADGRPLGVIALLHHSPIDDPQRAETYLRIVAVRAAAELEREQVQTALRANETRLQTFLDHAKDALYLQDDHARVIDVNQHACDSLGFSRDELVGAMPYKFDPDATKSLTDWVIDRLTNGETVAFESRHRRKNGTTFPVEVRIRPFWIDGKRYGLSIARDISEQKHNEAALQATQVRMAQILENANIGVWDWDIVTNLTRYSREWKSQLGHTESEISNRFEEWQSRVHPDDLEQALAKIEETNLRRYGVFEFEYRMRHKNGSWRWIFSRGTFIPSHSGPPTQLAGIHLDITERKRTEAALRSQLRVLELIATGERLPNILSAVVAHVEEQLSEFICSILLLNDDSATLHFGAAPNLPREYNESIEGLKIGPDVGSCGTAAYLKKTVIVSDIAKDPLWENFRDLALGFGLRSCWSAPIFAGGQPKLNNAKGRVLGTFALYGREPASPTEQHLQIVSAAANLAGIAIERHANEDAIRDSEDRLRTLLENLENVAVQAYEPNGTISFWNKASERVYGYTADEALGQDITQLLHSDGTQAFERQLIANALKGIELPKPEEVDVIRQDGSRITTYTKRILHRRPGRPPEFFRFDVDITDKKRAEQELAQRQAELFHTSRLSTLGQMVAALSHELAQPLTAIGNYASASLQLVDHLLPKPPENLHSYVEGISQQSQRCIAILQRLRDFSRRTPPSHSTCDVHRLVEDAVELVGTELLRRNVTLHMVLDEPLPLIVADRIQLQQVLVNLITNAIDAVRSQPVGKRAITIHGRRVEDEEEFELSVADTGTGLSSDDLDRLFEPFFTTKPEGMGIGLNICQSIVRQHGGRIEVRNNERGGATFSIRLPLS